VRSLPAAPDAETAPADLESPDIETASADYAQRFAGEVGGYFLDTQTRAVLELLTPWPRARVLDVGGGHGQIAAPLVARGYDVTVVGSNQRCRERLDLLLKPGSFAFVSGNILELPFADDSFDVVMAFRLLPHVRRWRRLVAEMCRVASAAVICDYPDLRSVNLIQRPFFAWKRRIEKNTRPFECFTRRQLTWEFAKHGFGQATFRPQFLFPMVAHRALKSAALSRALERTSEAVGLTRAFGSPVVLRVVPTRHGDGPNGGRA
jgi:ubiquinone/menaquinone biosynthesis C-methylase UbiE